MLPKDYSLTVPFPPGSGTCKLLFKGKVIKEFSYITSDITITQYAYDHRNAMRMLEQHNKFKA